MSDDYKPVLRPGSDPLVFFKYPGEEQSNEIARGQIMASVMSRALRNGELVIMGANSLLPMAAARLAQQTHAPNLTFIAGASGGVNTLVEPLVPSSGDYSNIISEAILTFDEVLAIQNSGRADVFFAGGMQIDRVGNCNLVGVGAAGDFVVRGPGNAGLPAASRVKRTILYTTGHSRKLFVEKVDYISLRGHGAARITPHGGVPAMVVTPLCVMDFSPAGLLRLKSLHPNVTLEQVQDNTSFDLGPRVLCKVTEPPSAEELDIMRGFDLDGLLTVVA